MTDTTALTAMQELIKWVSTELRLEGYEHSEIEKKATELLNKEREQIQDAFDYGKYCANIGTDNEFNKTSSNYYTETFTSK